MDWWIDRWSVRQIGRQKCRQTDSDGWQINRQTDSEINRLTDKQKDRQKDGQFDGQINRQMDKQIYIDEQMDFFY